MLEQILTRRPLRGILDEALADKVSELRRPAYHLSSALVDVLLGQLRWLVLMQREEGLPGRQIGVERLAFSHLDR